MVSRSFKNKKCNLKDRGSRYQRLKEIVLHVYGPVCLLEMPENDDIQIQVMGSLLAGRILGSSEFEETNLNCTYHSTRNDCGCCDDRA